MLNLLISYLCLFLLILLYKKVFFIRIAMNSIWFSEDGAISKDGIDNLIQLANDLKQSPYRRNYALFLWTDISKIQTESKKQLRKHGIKIKDYRDAFSSDDSSKQSQAWIEKSIALGNANNTMFYMIASDIFRLFLLLQYYPRQGAYSYACYFDCNDIIFESLPNPRVFRKLECLAFRSVMLNYSAFPLIETIMQHECPSQLSLSNDLIITNNKNNSDLFKEIYTTYLGNLNLIQHDEKNWLDLVAWTSDIMPLLHKDFIAVIVFSTTYVANLFCVNPDDTKKIDLCSYQAKGNVKKPLRQLQNTEDFIRVERIDDKGFTWVPQNNQTEKNTGDNEKQAQCRAFWYQTFTQRYALRF